jgi:hypothetical protein
MGLEVIAKVEPLSEMKDLRVFGDLVLSYSTTSPLSLSNL